MLFSMLREYKGVCWRHEQLSETGWGEQFVETTSEWPLSHTEHLNIPSFSPRFKAWDIEPFLLAIFEGGRPRGQLGVVCDLMPVSLENGYPNGSFIRIHDKKHKFVNRRQQSASSGREVDANYLKIPKYCKFLKVFLQVL
eukprot:531148-Pelagomonas_calceolata.AAC.4